MRFKDLSLKSKQIVSLGLVVIVVASASAYALRQVQLMKDDIDEVSKFWLKRSETIGKLAINVALVRLNQLQMSATTNQERREDYARNAIARLDSVAANWDRFSAIRLDPLNRAPDSEERRWAIKEQSAFEALDDSWDDYLGELLFFLDPDEELNEETRTRIFDKSEGDFRAVSNHLAELIAINHDAWRVTEIEADASFVRARLVTRLIVFGAVIISILIIMVLVRLISKPLTELARAAERVAAGDRSVYIVANSKDEIGRLSKAFNRMTVSLRNQESELLRRQAATEEKNSELQDALEKLTETQQQLIVREKMASLGQLTAGIAHEIKNPLNFVNNFARLSKELTEELVDELKEHPDRLASEVLDDLGDVLEDLTFNAARIQEHGSRADSIVKNMLLHSRGKPGEKVRVNLNKLLNEYATLSYHGMRGTDRDFNCEVIVELSDDLPEIDIVHQSMGRVFLNILNNAYYAVRDRAGEKDSGFSPTVTVRTSVKEEAIVIAISDNGTGMPPDVVEKVFEPFFTTKPTGSGTGLGMSLAYDIVTDEHGGTIEVESEEGVGTTFTITLPT